MEKRRQDRVNKSVLCVTASQGRRSLCFKAFKGCFFLLLGLQARHRRTIIYTVVGKQLARCICDLFFCYSDSQPQSTGIVQTRLSLDASEEIINLVTRTGAKFSWVFLLKITNNNRLGFLLAFL